MRDRSIVFSEIVGILCRPVCGIVVTTATQLRMHGREERETEEKERERDEREREKLHWTSPMCHSGNGPGDEAIVLELVRDTSFHFLSP